MKARFVHLVADIDVRLLSVSKGTQVLVIAVTMIVMVLECLPFVPRPYVDYSQTPILRNVRQNQTFGSDTIADMYEAKVILNDPSDMYTKTRLPQTPEEAALWSKEESSPYPPAMLLAEAGLYAVGRWTGLGFYGMILILAAVFLALSAFYFLATRWYLFPLLYLNCVYVGYRFVFVQDGSYLVMLVVVMAALLLARGGRQISHALMAVAIDLKLGPLYYIKNLPNMRRRTALLFAGIVFVGLVLPYFIWDNYLYIYQFNARMKGNRYGLVAGVGYGSVFSGLLWYVEARLGFDLEEKIGWSLVPFAMCLAMRTNAARHLLIPLLVPDKRGPRNIVAAIALGLPILFPGLVRFGATLSITTGLLFIVLAWHLKAIGWRTVWADARQPRRTFRLMVGSTGDLTGGVKP